MKRTTLFFTLLLVITITQSTYSSQLPSSSPSSSFAASPQKLHVVNLYEQRSLFRRGVDTLKHHSNKLALTSLAAAALVIYRASYYDEFNVKELFATPTLLFCAASLFRYIDDQTDKLRDAVLSFRCRDESFYNEEKNKTCYNIAQSAISWGAYVYTEVRIFKMRDNHWMYRGGGTLLYAAVMREWLEGVELLIKNGANPNAKGRDMVWPIYDITPLYLAAEAGNKEIVKILIQHGANIDEQDRKGNTPLHRAALNGYLNIVEILINQGAKKDLKNKDHKTPYDLAIDNKIKEWTVLD